MEIEFTKNTELAAHNPWVTVDDDKPSGVSCEDKTVNLSECAKVSNCRVPSLL